MNKNIIENLLILQKYNTLQKNKWKATAYSKAISTIKNLNFEISDSKQVKNLRFIGSKIYAKINELLTTGFIQEVEKVKPFIKTEPKRSQKQLDMEKLQLIWGIGPKKAEELYNLGFNNIEKLRKNPILLTKKQKIGLKYYEDILKKIPRTIIQAFHIFIIIQLNKIWGKGNYLFDIAGSYRRGKIESGDIDILISSDHFNLKDFVNLLEDKKIIVVNESMKNEKFMGIIKCPTGYGHFMRLDIQFIPKESWASALLYFTGSKNNNLYMRSMAKKMGMVLNQHGLFKNNKKINTTTEQDIFKLLHINYIKPQNR